MDGLPEVGQRVLYRVGGTHDHPELRAALVVRTFGGPTCNLQVLVDGSNDAAYFAPPEYMYGLAWRTSVLPGLGIGQWRRPEHGLGTGA